MADFEEVQHEDETMDEAAIVGHVDWRACNQCKNYNRKAGGCLDGDGKEDGTHRFGDFIYCDYFEKDVE